MEPLAVAVIWMVLDAVISLSLTFTVRSRLDTDGDGHVSRQEMWLPALSSFRGRVVVQNAGLYNYTLQTNGQTLFEAFLHAFAYGAITVMTCNFLLAGTVDDSIGWLMSTLFCHVNAVYMCAFATNTIHVATSHLIHFVYYGFCFIPMAFYARPPPVFGGWLTAAYVVQRLALDQVLKRMAWPSYPGPADIFPVYCRQSGGQTWELTSSPDDGRSSEERTKAVPAGPMARLTQVALPFPTYEVLNTHLTSSFSIGLLIGLLTIGLAPPSPVAMLAGSCAAAVFCFVLHSLDFAWYPLKRMTLARFFPRLMGAVLCGAGAVMAIAGFAEGGANGAAAAPYASLFGEFSAVAIVAGHFAHVLGVGLFVFAYLAGAKHFGLVHFCRRLAPTMGDGGVKFEPEIPAAEKPLL